MRINSGTTARNTIMTAGIINVILGIWLIISPWIFRYVSTRAYWNGVILGIAIGIIALIRVITPYQTGPLSWLNVILGIWLIISPFVLRLESTAAHWNTIIVGIIVVLVALWSASVSRSGNPTPAP